MLKAEYQLPGSRYPTDMRNFPNFAEAHTLNRELLSRISSTPGVISAALAGNHPLDAGFTNSFVVVGRESEASDWPKISVRRVTPGYFRTVQLQVSSGRPFRESDDTDASRVALINESAAARFFPDQDPIGFELGFWRSRRRIVGVVADERSHGLEQAEPLAVYLPLSQAPSTDGTYALLVRTAGDPSALTATARRIVRDIDPALALFEPLDQTLSRSIGQRRFIVMLLGLFAALAILLAVAGVQGVLSHSVA